MGESNTLDEQKPVLGGLLYLSSHSPLHRNYRIQYLIDRIDWSIANRTYRYYEINGRPIGFCAWVYSSQKVIDEVMSTGREFESAELGIDSEIFITEFLAPFGHTRRIVRDLKDHCFPNARVVFALRGRVLCGHPDEFRFKKFKFTRS